MRRHLALTVSVALLVVSSTGCAVLLERLSAAAAIPDCSATAPTPTDVANAQAISPILTGKLRGAFTAGRAACANTIVATTRARGLPLRAAEIAVTTAIVESNIENLNYGDRDSLGLFQQRPGMGWGTPDQVRDPIYATNKFLDAMVDKYPNSSWQTERIGDVCQRVQISAFPDRYHAEGPDGVRIATELWQAAPV